MATSRDSEAVGGGATATDPPRSEVRTLLALAWPTILSRAGIMVMVFVDIVMVGRYSITELAYAALGMSLFSPLLVAGIGAMLGVAILTAQHYGAGRLKECGATLRRSLPWALVIGSAAALLLCFGEFWLRLLGHSADMADGGGAVARAAAVAVPAQLVYVCLAFHLESTRRPLPGMIAMVGANLLNIALNWVFVYGNLGAPAMGAVGSAWTTTATRVFLVVALGAYIFTRIDRAAYGVHLRYASFWGDGGWRAGARMRRLGYGAGASYGIETTAFAMMLQFAGWMGETTLSAYAIAQNVLATFFMAALGVGSATAVLVGNALGARDLERAASAGRLGLATVALIMAAFGAIAFLAAESVAAIYTPDAALRALVAPMLFVVALATVADGAQLVAAQSARALGDVWPTTINHVVAFWLVMLPLGYALGLWLDGGGPGLMAAVTIASIVSLALHWRRFRRLIARMRADARRGAR